jgi:hypothetical protein
MNKGLRARTNQRPQELRRQADVDRELRPRIIMY